MADMNLLPVRPMMGLMLKLCKLESGLSQRSRLTRPSRRTVKCRFLSFPTQRREGSVDGASWPQTGSDRAFPIPKHPYHDIIGGTNEGCGGNVPVLLSDQCRHCKDKVRRWHTATRYRTAATVEISGGHTVCGKYTQ